MENNIENTSNFINVYNSLPDGSSAYRNSNANINIITETTENTTMEEITTEYISSDYSEQLTLIHQDLGFICSFLIAFILVILLKYAYKFLNMFF